MYIAWFSHFVEYVSCSLSIEAFVFESKSAGLLWELASIPSYALECFYDENTHE
jgi:hypothetical protein